MNNASYWTEIAKYHNDKLQKLTIRFPLPNKLEFL